MTIPLLSHGDVETISHDSSSVSWDFQTTPHDLSNVSRLWELAKRDLSYLRVRREFPSLTEGYDSSFPLSHVHHNWSSLPQEVLQKIAKILTVNADYVRFRAVCKTWRFASPKTPTHLLCQSPWLMTHRSELRFCFTVSSTNLHHTELSYDACIGGMHCFGSSQGWLGFFQPLKLFVLLLNPLTNYVIYLPQITTPMEEFFFWRWSKVVLSQNPSSHKCIVMVLDTGKLIVCTAGDRSWTVVGKGYHDVSYHNGQIYGITSSKDGEQLRVCDPNDLKEKVFHISYNQRKQLDSSVSKNEIITINNADLLETCSYKRSPIQKDMYLVDLVGDLVLVSGLTKLGCVAMSGKNLPQRTLWFSVYRFDQEMKQLIRMKNLGEHTLFVGRNSSFSFAVDTTSSNVYRSNCIYFTNNDAPSTGENGGIFCLEDGSIEPLPYSGDIFSLIPHSEPPMWFTPSLC